MTDPLAALRRLFVERCRDDLQALRRLADQPDAEAICFIAHRLAGAAGSFGFPELGQAALAVDEQCRDHGRVPEADMERLLKLVEKAAFVPEPPA